MAVVVVLERGREVSERGQEAYTEVCEIFSPSLHDPPVQPRANNALANSHYHCPRCDTTYSRSYTVKQHFPRCIETNGNPDSLRWFDHESHKLTGTRKQTNTKTAGTSSKRKRMDFSLDPLLEDEPEVIMTMAKVGKWATMTAEKQTANVTLTSNTSNKIGHSRTHNPTAVMASAVDTSSYTTTPMSNKSAMTPTTTTKKARPFATLKIRDESVIPASKQKQPRSRKPQQRKRITHDEDTAHLFNNAGVLMPSIPGIDSVTERLFDRGEVMSLGPSRSHNNYYPNGEPHGGSFILGHPCDKKRKRDSQS